MAISTRNPLYSTFLTDWQLCRHSYEGERVVKSEGTKYLPATPGQEADGMRSAQDRGYKSYQSYKERAVFPEFVSDAVEYYMGLLWSKPPVIELPEKLEPLRENLTTKGESVTQLLRRIHEQQLVTGRCGLLLDLPSIPDPERPLPYIAMYMAEHIINWDNGSRDQVRQDSLNLVVLDESEFVRSSDFEWDYENKYRVLLLGETLANEETGTYSVGVFDEQQTTFSEANMVVPSIRGNTLDKIPFVFVNSKDIVAEPDNPPLVGLARLCMTIYKGEADYRQSLFLQGQDTLVITGADEDDDVKVGAGSVIALSSGGDAKFIGVRSDGLSEQRQALENDKVIAANKAGELIDTRSKQKESGDALVTRMAAKSATLNQIAITAAESLERILRIAAEWVGANPEDVIVTPNLDFTNTEMQGKSLVDYMTAKSLGAPLSNKSIHKLMQDKNVTELEYEEELSEIESEQPLTDEPDEDLGVVNEDE